MNLRRLHPLLHSEPVAWCVYQTDARSVLPSMTLAQGRMLRLLYGAQCAVRTRINELRGGCGVKKHEGIGDKCD